jgi:hypothetical protein
VKLGFVGPHDHWGAEMGWKEEWVGQLCLLCHFQHGTPKIQRILNWNLAFMKITCLGKRIEHISLRLANLVSSF